MSCKHKHEHHEIECSCHHEHHKCCEHEHHHHHNEHHNCGHHHEEHHHSCGCCHDHSGCGCGHNHANNHLVLILIRAALSVVLMVISTFIEGMAKNIILIVKFNCFFAIIILDWRLNNEQINFS